MFKLIGTILIASVLALSAQAEESVADSQSKDITQYDVLLEKFKNGTQPTQEEMLGPTKGFCYRKNSPNIAYVTHLVGENREGTYQGPLFPKPQLLRFAIFWSYWADFTILDNSSAKISDNAWVSWDYKEGKLTVVRKNEGYLFASIITQTDIHGYRAGDTIATCYFFESEVFP